MFTWYIFKKKKKVPKLIFQAQKLQIYTKNIQLFSNVLTFHSLNAKIKDDADLHLLISTSELKYRAGCEWQVRRIHPVELYSGLRVEKDLYQENKYDQLWLENTPSSYQAQLVSCKMVNYFQWVSDRNVKSMLHMKFGLGLYNFGEIKNFTFTGIRVRD